LKVVLEKIKTKGESSKNFGRRWLTIILSVIGGIFLLGIGFASIFSTQFIAAVGRFLNLISDAFGNFVYYLFLAIGFLVEWIYYAVEWIINLFTHGKTPKPPQIGDLGNSNNPKGTIHALPPWVLLTLKLTLLALVLLGVLFLIVRAIRRSHQTPTEKDLDEEHESLWSWGGFKSDIVLFFKMLFQRFKRKAKPVTTDVSLNWHPEEDIKHRLSIREIYQHLLWQGACLRIPREDSETPSEYARRLGRFAPDGREPLNEITSLYIDVRYGEHQMEDKRIDDANSNWGKLLNILKGPEGK
jgi:hypothetical protein